MFKIKQNIPKKLSLTVKENIPALTGTIISPHYFLSVKDYQNLVLTTNNIVDILTNIYPYINNLDFSSQKNLKQSITYIVNSNFNSITKINDEVVTDPNINVLTRFKINNKVYKFNIDNKGNIIIPDHLIPGNESDYVHTFNDKTGDVTGISGIILNGQLLSMNDGVINLSTLTFKNTYIISINNSIFSNITNIPNTIKNGDEIYYPQNNQGTIEINSFIFKNQQNDIINLIDSSSQNLQLENVDEENNQSAINKRYLQNNSLIIKQEVSSLVFTLPKPYYPLHFYDTNGWWKDIKWSIDSESNVVTINSTHSSLLETRHLICTAMKVEE